MYRSAEGDVDVESRVKRVRDMLWMTSRKSCWSWGENENEEEESKEKGKKRMAESEGNGMKGVKGNDGKVRKCER